MLFFFLFLLFSASRMTIHWRDAAAAGGTRGGATFEEEEEESEEEDAAAVAATPPPARSPNAAFPAPPLAFAMAPALEAMAAAETAKALESFGFDGVFGFGCEGKKGRRVEEVGSAPIDRK